MKKHHGIALVVVLWVITLVGIMAAVYLKNIRIQTTITGNMLDSAKARAAVNAGLHIAVRNLVAPDTGSPWAADGVLHHTRFGQAQLDIIMLDEDGKIDLNKAPSRLIENLFRASGTSDERAAYLTAAILDWRDTDDLKRLNGAEKTDYSAHDLTGLPRDGPFRSTEELLLVSGMDIATYEKVADSITVHSGRQSADLAAASPLTAMAIRGLTPNDGNDGRTDYQAGAGSPLNQVVAPVAGKRTSGRGDVISIYLQARMPNGATNRGMAIIRLNPGSAGKPFTRLAWKTTSGNMFDKEGNSNGIPE